MDRFEICLVHGPFETAQRITKRRNKTSRGLGETKAWIEALSIDPKVWPLPELVYHKISIKSHTLLPFPVPSKYQVPSHAPMLTRENLAASDSRKHYIVYIFRKECSSAYENGSAFKH